MAKATELRLNQYTIARRYCRALSKRVSERIRFLLLEKSFHRQNVLRPIKLAAERIRNWQLFISLFGDEPREHYLNEKVRTDISILKEGESTIFGHQYRMCQAKCRGSHGFQIPKRRGKHGDFFISLIFSTNVSYKLLSPEWHPRIFLGMNSDS